jgi:surface polysaccharide O-acyltransferase-like enzyme
VTTVTSHELAMLIFETVLRWKATPPRLVTLVSRNSLWIYGLHPLVGASLALVLPTPAVFPVTLVVLVPLVWLVCRSPLPGVLHEPAPLGKAA